MRRYRILSLICAILVLFSLAAAYAAQNSLRFQLRGTTNDFPQPVAGAEFLRLGVNVDLQQYDDNILNVRLSELAGQGVKYIRQEFHWADLEPQQGQFVWAAADRILEAAQRNSLQILVVFITTPGWARADTGSATAAAIETMPPRDAQDFAVFVREFALRYDKGNGAILAYQVWDEPNLSAKWGDALISPIGYLRLLRAGQSGIRSVNPSAQIVLAGLAPTAEQSDVNLAPERYLAKLYEAGGRDAFDIVATKAYGYDSPPEDRRVELDIMNFSRAILVRETMVAHGDGAKAVWLTQWGWNAQLPGWSGRSSVWSGVSETQQAQYTVNAVQRVAQEWNWAGAMFLSTLQPDVKEDDPVWGFALLDQQGKPRPTYEVLKQIADIAKSATRAQWASVASSGTQSGIYLPNPTASFSEGWRFSERGADIPQRDDAGVTFRFEGDALALIVRRDDYRAYMFITIDGKPANLLSTEARGAYLILSSPDRAPHVDTLEVADSLGAGVHTAKITIDRGWNQWSLVGWSSHAAPDLNLTVAQAAFPVALLIGVSALIGLGISFKRAMWLEAAGKWLPHARNYTWQTAGTAIVLWLSASVTWAQDAATAYRNIGTPAYLVVAGVVSGVAFWSPIFVISMIALAVLFVLVMLRIDIGLMLAAFFIPFYLIPQRIFAWAFPMVELLTLMCFASWLWQRWNVWRQSKDTHAAAPRLLLAKITLMDWGIISLVAVSALSAAQAEFQIEALRELRMVIVEPALLYLMLRSTKLDSRQLWRIVDALILSAVVVALVGLVNYARGYTFSAELGIPRIRSIYGSPNNDGLYLGRALPVLLAMAVLGRRTDGKRRFEYRRVLYICGTVIVAVALFLSASRGALLLGIPVAVIVMCLLSGRRWRVIGIGLSILMIAGLGVLLSGVLNPYLQGTRFANALDMTQGTGFFRINLWQSAFRMWLDHPVLGVGPDNFLYAYRGHYILPAAWQEPNLSHPHNIVLDFATRLGILGIGTLIVMVVGLVRNGALALRISRGTTFLPLAVGLAGLLADVVAHGLVDHSLFLVDLMYVFMLCAGVLAQIAHNVQIPKETLSKR